jgi:hypothetical protein
VAGEAPILMPEKRPDMPEAAPEAALGAGSGVAVAADSRLGSESR